jgi:hypothetical protein
MSLKDKISEFVALAKQCPDNLQETCFRVLLEDFLASGKRTPPVDTRKTSGEDKPESPTPPDTGSQGDIRESDIHVKVKRFMEKEGVSLDDLNQVFYKEGESFLPLFDSLGTTKTSESQIRVSLLRALQAALATGDFAVNLDEVKLECQQRKCYDGSNWGNNFSNNARLFDFKKFSKDIKSAKLSDAGKKELADLLKQLK